MQSSERPCKQIWCPQGSQAFERDTSAIPTARSTLSRKVRTPKLIKNTREKIRRNPQRSVPKLASASGVSYETMETVLKNDLNLSPYKITKVQLLSEAKTKRMLICKAFSVESEGWHATSGLGDRWELIHRTGSS